MLMDTSLVSLHTELILDLSFFDRIWGVVLDHLGKIYARLVLRFVSVNATYLRLIPILAVVRSQSQARGRVVGVERGNCLSHANRCCRCERSLGNVRS